MNAKHDDKMLRRDTPMKKLALLHELKSLGSKCKNVGIDNMAVTASYLAKRLGYKSAVSVRKQLYELVDEGKLRMITGESRGAVDTLCWFYHPDYPVSEAVEFNV